MIYLCGKMGGLPVEIAKKWRNEFKTDFYNCYNVDGYGDIFDPSEYFNYGMEEGIDYTNHELFMFEHRMIQKAQVVVANLDGIETSVGSLMELAWAYERGSAIIGFATEPTTLHPWIEEALDKKIVGDDAIKEAAQYVADMYGWR